MNVNRVEIWKMLTSVTRLCAQNKNEKTEISRRLTLGPRAHVLSIGIKPNAAQEEELAVGQLREEAKDW